MRQIVPLLASVVTIAAMWLAGNQKKAAWVLGLVNQAVWLLFIVSFGAWGLLPLTGALVVVYTRNLLRWTREAA